jgi:hypothetical protein
MSARSDPASYFPDWACCIAAMSSGDMPGFGGAVPELGTTLPFWAWTIALCTALEVFDSLPCFG